MRSRSLLTAVATVCVLAGPGLAQDTDNPEPRRERQDQRQNQRQNRMRPLSPEQARAAWELQATSVALELGLDEFKMVQLTKTYIEARDGHRQATREKMRELRDSMRSAGGGEGRGGGGGGEPGARRPRGEGDQPGARRPRGEGGRAEGEAGERGQRRRGAGFAGGEELQKMMAELQKQQQEKLSESFSTFLEGEKLGTAVKVLGTFDNRWDMMVHAVSGLELGQAKTFATMKPIQDYVVTTAKLRQSTENREALREAMQAEQQKLETALSSAIDDEQMETLRQAIRAGSRQRGFGGGGRRGGDGA